MSGEYVPTTEEVREHFMEAHGKGRPTRYDRDLFDRWLADHDAAIRAEVRASLIATIDASPAVTWAGKGGVKEHIEALIAEGTP